MSAHKTGSRKPVDQGRIVELINKCKLLFASRRTQFRFFYPFAHKFLWSPHDMPDDREGYIQWDMKRPTRASMDGIIHINENILNKLDYKHGNLLCLIVHELLHILHKHSSRIGSRDPKLWNVACDHCIDRDIEAIIAQSESKAIVIPYRGRFNTIKELHKEFPDCSAEEAYEWLLKKKDSGKYTITQNFTPQGGLGSIHIKDNETGEEWTVDSNSGGTDYQNLSEKDKSKLSQLSDNMLAEARALYEIGKCRGLIPGAFATYLDKLLEVKIPWEELLEKSIKTNVILKPDERSWVRPNPYYMGIRLYLPGASMTETSDGVGTLVIWVDTSGSVSDESLKKSADVIHNSLRYFKKVYVVQHDSAITDIAEFKGNEQAKFLQYMKSIGFKGRGGTSHGPAFEWIKEKIWDEPRERGELSMIISLTDGESDIEMNYKNFEWCKTVPTVFIIDGQWKYNFDYDNFSMITID